MTPTRPRIALAIPAYNATRHLPRLIESVHAQTEPFDELLVYDDASTDGTADMARSLGAHVIRTDTNTGPSHGKNVMAEAATSEWIHFHDADEALAPEFVARARQLCTDAVDVVLFGTEDRDDDSGVTLGRRDWNDRDVARDAIRYCILNTVTNCGVYRRERFLAVGGFDTDPATKYNEDQAMHLRLALEGLRFRAVDYVGVIVYRRSGSMSSGHPIECARAQYEVLARTAVLTGARYAAEIGSRLWKLAGVLGGFADWTYVHRALSLASELGYDPVDEHVALRLIARVSPIGAIRTREALIRVLKPELRRGAPVVRT